MPDDTGRSALGTEFSYASENVELRDGEKCVRQTTDFMGQSTRWYTYYGPFLISFEWK